MSEVKYRPEIDGLRALAVIPVILFHAGLQSFSGGYVGVDVFFVVSGYLITSIILKEKQAGQFSLLRFYERRARRILPALFFVMLVCWPLAWKILSPGELLDFSRSVVAVTLFMSNMYFWKTTGYFSAAAEDKPLLHTWSLGVEEQYYLFFPLFVGALWSVNLRRLLIAICTIGVLSFAASLALMRGGYITANFFFAPTRAWELLVGSVLATVSFHSNILQRVSLRSRGILAVAGILSICVAIYWYDARSPFPLYGLLPTIGTALILAFGTSDTTVGRTLAHRSLVTVGLISYSAYLWHQPLFAFVRVRTLDHPPAWGMAAASIGSLLLAYGTWRFIETPFRNRSRVARKQVWRFAAAGMVCFIAVGATGNHTRGFASRSKLPAHVVQSFARTPRETECFDIPHAQTREDGWFCEVGAPGGPATFGVIGDSHAISLLPAFDRAAAQSGAHGFFSGTSGCIPLLQIYALRNDQGERDCHAINLRLFDYIKRNNIKEVFLVGRWTYYTDGGYEGRDWSYIALAAHAPAAQESSRAAFESGLKTTIRAYAAIGVHAYAVEQIPQQKYDPKDVYFRAYAGPKPDSTLRELSVDRTEHNRLQAYVRRVFEANRNALFDVISLDADFCDDQKCGIGDTQHSFYFDSDHLSVTGSLQAAAALEKYVRLAAAR